MTATIRRRPNYYIFNVIFPMLSFTVLTFFQWAVPLSEVADRMSITLTLLLTAAASSLSISELKATLRARGISYEGLL